MGGELNEHTNFYNRYTKNVAVYNITILHVSSIWSMGGEIVNKSEIEGIEKQVVNDLLKRVLGEIQPMGSSEYDKECLENIKRWEFVLNFISKELQDVCFYNYSSPYGSEKKVGLEAARILKKHYNDLKDLIYDLENDNL